METITDTDLQSDFSQHSGDNKNPLSSRRRVTKSAARHLARKYAILVIFAALFIIIIYSELRLSTIH